MVLDKGKGDTYNGEWEGGRRHGRGVMRYVDSKTRFEGEWKLDEMGVGVIEVYYADGSLYKGDWVDNCRNGTGTFLFRYVILASLPPFLLPSLPPSFSLSLFSLFAFN